MNAFQWRRVIGTIKTPDPSMYFLGAIRLSLSMTMNL